MRKIAVIASFIALILIATISIQFKNSGQLYFIDFVSAKMNELNLWPSESFRARYRRFHVMRRLDVNGISFCARNMINELDLCEASKNCVSTAAPGLEKLIQEEGAKGGLALGPRKQLLNLYAYDLRTLSKSLQLLQDSYQKASQLGDRNSALNFLARAGIVQTRLGELANCVNNHNASSCVFPLAIEARHIDRAGSLAAWDTFLAYLKERPDDLHVKFLLNIVAQTLGRYPHGVPPQYLLKEFVTPEMKNTPFPRFPNIADNLGINDKSRSGRGILLEDINQDGNVDILMASRHFCDSLTYLESEGKGGYVDKSDASGLSTQTYIINAYTADYDNDGDLDIYLTRGAFDEWPFASKHVVNSLLQNDGKGTFKDVSDLVGLEDEWNTSTVARFFDADNDGWLDLFVCNDRRKHEFYLNNRDGTFRKALSGSGIDEFSVCKGLAVGDVNGDGLLDMYISNYPAKNALYLNRGKGKFEKDKQEAITRPIESFGAFFFDYDNDGDLDIFANDFESDNAQSVRSLIGLESRGETTRLFQNDGKGIFTDVSQQAGLNKSFMGMFSQFGDLNNDGFPDILIGTGSFSLGDLIPNRAFLNNQGHNFIDVTTKGGFGNLQKGHGIAFADLNNDGNQEAMAMFGGKSQADMFYQSLYENPGFGNRWITLKLEGVNANRSAIDSKIKVDVVENGKERSIYSWVNSGSATGSNSLQAEIGLGRASKIKKLTITWHGSGHIQHFENIKLDSFYQLREGGELLEDHRSKFAFSKAKKHHHHHE